MRLSNKSTFSLACFIFLLALGFLYAVTPVMAHPPGSAERAHDHPLTETLTALDGNGDNDTSDPGEAEVTPHNSHPMVTSIVLKGDNTRGTMAAVVADDTATTDVSENQFTLVVTFDQDIVTDATTAAIPAFDANDLTSGAALASGDLTESILNVDRTVATGASTFVVNRVMGNDAQYEIVVTPGTLPNADGDDATTNDNTLMFRIQVNANTVFSLQTSEVVQGQVAPVTVNGGGNFVSDAYAFTLLSELPEAPTPADTTAPTLTITHDPADMAALPTSGNVTFTFTFNEALGMNDASLSLGDITITNGRAVDFTEVTDNMVYTLEVMPDDPMMNVTVMVAASAVADAAQNNLAADVMETYMADDTVAPTVMISAVPEMDANDMATGKIVYTFTFSEPLAANSFTADDIIRSTGVTLAGNPMMDATDNKVYTVLVNPAATGDTILTLKTGSVMDMQGNALEGDQQHKYVAPEAPVDPPDPAMDPSGANYSGVITIPAAASEGAHNSNGDAFSSFVVVVRSKAAMGADGLAFRDDVMVEEWPGMPDLERLFYTGNDGIILGGGGGGALILTESVTQTGDFAPGTVGISEIMWGINASFLGEDREDASQWIELHNLNATEAKVILSWKTGRDITSDNKITGNLANPQLDVVTNFFNDRPGSARWEVPGNSGSSVGGADFVSMARTGTFSKLRRHENKTDKDFNSRYTRTAGAGNSRDGRNSGHWAASTASYLRLRTTLTDQTDVVYNYVGTPGRVNTFSADTQPNIRASRRDVPASPVIFNEIANRADSHSGYEWIELRNVTDGKVNLRNWLISIVTSNSSDAVFYQFPNNNNAQIEPQGVLLLVASDPRGNPDHPLAVGWNVDVNPEDQPRGLAEIGITASSKHGRYKVADTGAAGMFGGDRSGLPDGGNFVLILRSQDNHDGQRSGVDGGKGVAETGNNDLNRVVDIAGWSDQVGKNSYPNAVSSTGIWPLHQMGGTFSHNKLDADKVHYRRHRTTPDGRAGAGAHENKNEGGKAAYARGVGYSGIGYKRQAMDSGVHGGDPGYHGMTKNSAHDNDGGSRVYISEIMLSQGDGRTKLPQWIELYNASDYAVNLSGGDGVGWRLVIENPDDPIRTINFRSKGNVKTINPKQTVLIISGSARSFGSDHLPSSTVFPDTRVFNVYKELKGHFDMAGRTSAIINPTAFNIKLIDGGKKINDVVTYTTSDEIGNLDGNARTNDQGMWEYPMSVTEDGYRSSLIRIFDGGTPREGLSMMESNVKPLGGTAGEGVDGMDGIDMKYSWVHAADTDFVDIFVRHTWYGSENDFGTPANRAAQVLPVELSSFRPALEDGQVVVRWATESELDNAGFNILRSEERDGEYKQVNTELIAGNGTTGERNTYKWVDATAKPGVVYYYQIEDVSFAGERQALALTKLKGLISADNKLTTTWGELKEVQ